MSRCHSRHSSSTCSSLPAVAPFVLCIHFTAFPPPDRTPVTGARASHTSLSLATKDYAFTSSDVGPSSAVSHKGVISGVLHAVMDERKKKVTATFQTRSANRRQKRWMSGRVISQLGQSLNRGIADEPQLLRESSAIGISRLRRLARSLSY